MADNEEDVDVNELTDVNQTEDTETVESADSDESLNSEGEVNAPAKKNKSNWKKMKQENKALKAKIAQFESSNDDDSSDEDDSDDTDEPISTQYAPIELKVLFLENPVAKEYESEIRANLKKYPDMDFDDAFKLAKASNPVSETKRNLSFKSSSKPKDLASLPQEDALKLEPAEYLKWARATGNVKE